ncbi:MAG: hypothetical protein RLZZ142_1518 [Verrucomicrobiota bacterium]
MNSPSSPLSRRQLLGHALHGSMGLGLLSMLGAESQALSSSNAAAQAFRTHPAKARRVILIFLDGGLSHVDSFDYKPRLFSEDSQRIANNVFTGMGQQMTGTEGVFLKRPDWSFTPCGQSGMWISSLFPHLQSQADSLCMINSLHTSHANHFEAVVGMHTGSFNQQRPSIGSWCTYALGSESQNLPGFVALASELPYGGSAAFGSDFLPGEFQGVRIRPGAEPIKYLRSQRSPGALAAQREIVAELNEAHFQERPWHSALHARMQAWRTAGGMQTAAPEVLDLSKESPETLAAYGVHRPGAAGTMAWKCLVARRLIEKGVRFVEVVQRGWDSHGDLRKAHGSRAEEVDQPTAALLVDLKQRGLLEDTLVVFTTEFGRTPANASPGKDGRDHHPHAFSSWLAGAGVRPGITHGKTDEHGIRIAEGGVHVHDFHATILHLLGIDHTKLTFRHAGRDYRLTDVEGEPVRDILA